MNADFNVGALSITGQVAGVPWASVVVCQCGRSQYFAAWRPAKHTLMKLGCYSSFFLWMFVRLHFLHQPDLAMKMESAHMLEKWGSGVEHGHLGEFLIFLAGIDSGGYYPVNHEDQISAKHKLSDHMWKLIHRSCYISLFVSRRLGKMKLKESHRQELGKRHSLMNHRVRNEEVDSCQ